MLERFTDPARKVMALALQEANRFNHPFIGDEHILQGLVKEGSGIGAIVLQSLHVDLGRLRQEVEKLAGRGPSASGVGKLPGPGETRRVLTYAAEESEALHHDYVGTGHLLLGLLRHADGAGAKMLTAVGVDLDKAREEVLAVLKGAAGDTAEGRPREEVLAGLTDRYADHPLIQRYRTLLQELLRERDAALDRRQYEIAVFHRDAAAAVERVLWRIVTFLERGAFLEHDAGPDQDGPKDA
jgi:ATP-dependent Clp protease ATP-binding subunit ClpC